MGRVVAGTKAHEGPWRHHAADSFWWLFRIHETTTARRRAVDMTLAADVRHDNRVIVPISGVQRAVIGAIDYARTLSSDGAPCTSRRSCVPANPDRLGKWSAALVVVRVPFRSLMEPLLEYIEQLNAEHPDDYVTVVLPEFVPARWWHHLFHNQRALLIKGALLFKPNTIVTSVPFHLKR